MVVKFLKVLSLHIFNHSKTLHLFFFLNLIYDAEIINTVLGTILIHDYVY